MALLVLLKFSYLICSMIDGLKKNTFVVTDQMLSDLLSLKQSHNLFKMSRPSRSTMEKEMSNYDRERSLVKVREVSYN